ncbi:MAG: hypothetical protein AAGI01_11505 [Myxococcota bacterium]
MRLFSLKFWATCTAAHLGCDVAQERREADAPLQPLIYTEHPDITEEAVAARERRLMRELLDGAEEGGWGKMKRDVAHPTTQDATSLGRVLYDALVTRDEALWDHALVSPEAYAGLVRVSLEQARVFVDERLGASSRTWALFDVPFASHAPEGGLRQVFTFRALNLGQGRTLDGSLAQPNDRVVQHWGNVLELGLRERDVVFEITISKILRVVDRHKDPSGQPRLALASGVRPGPKLRAFIDAGMHLKPELLRTQEYPFPLAVGNFWRYRRSSSVDAPPPEPQPPAQPAPAPAADALVVESGASSALVEVVEVNRFGTHQLVHLRTSFDDQSLTKVDRWWLVTPRRIFPCSRSCRRNVEDVDWVLAYLPRHVPLFQWPLEAGDAWGRRFRVDDARRDLELPMGSFRSTLVLRDSEPAQEPFMMPRARVLFVAPGQGVVRREVTGTRQDGALLSVVEELVDSRIMP